MHTNCRTPAIARHKLGDAGNLKLLEWLCSGTVEPGATTERKKELGVLHKAMFRDIAGMP